MFVISTWRAYCELQLPHETGVLPVVVEPPRSRREARLLASADEGLPTSRQNLHVLADTARHRNETSRHEQKCLENVHAVSRHTLQFANDATGRSGQNSEILMD